ncbi:DUF3306 domain-containing protein [Massilia agri]|uniref:DUF3306 domain-containing protein n=1 Tax=Massilia agri TaxID=1886785 RepID=A0ABT2AQA2_9BURK|nr:DUF3306 domain-containing protein [Massilia agri]MCS0598434.1 DUF3306 domain-containing protein [Massilia agri]
MSEEGFFRRWSRLKATGEAAEARPAPAPVPVPVEAAAPAEPEAPARPPPTLEDAAGLTPESDFSTFVAKDVDKSVQRLALKKLFADPHFNVVDGLDMYMSDYNKASPMAPAMLASLQHAPGLLAQLLGDRRDADKEEEGPGGSAAEASSPIQQGNT